MSRTLPLLEALFVTFLWSTSFVLIKIGLEEISPLTFAAYRYSIATLILAIVYFGTRKSSSMRNNKKEVLLFLFLGVFGYYIAQGLQFVGLFYLSAVTVSFILNFVPLFVLGLGIVFLNEKPTKEQGVGLILTITGVYFYFKDTLTMESDFLGISVTLCAGLGWAIYMVITRHMMRRKAVEIVRLTVYSMGFGAILLMTTASILEKPQNISLFGWRIIIWLGLINTSFAFLMWNHALRRIRAFEQTILQNTMLAQIALLSYLFLNEVLTGNKIVGILLVFVGILIVQYFGQSTDTE